MGLALISGAPLLGFLLLVAVDRLVAGRAAAPAQVPLSAATSPPAAPMPSCFVPAPRASSAEPAGDGTAGPRRRRTPEDAVARTILRVGCGQEVVDRVLARAAILDIDPSTLWLWTHQHGVTGLVLALDAGLRHEELCEHLAAGTEPDWAALGVLAGLAADLRSTESCLAALDGHDLV
jgi:hypothetical protein